MITMKGQVINCIRTLCKQEAHLGSCRHCPVKPHQLANTGAVR